MTASIVAGDGSERDPGSPEIGAQFAQMVKELRTVYSNVTVICCERMTRDITQHPQHMIGNLIHQNGALPGNADNCARIMVEHSVVSASVDERMMPLFETLEKLLGELERMVDVRVLIALTRGVWEHLSDDLYIFVENLQENHDCPVRRHLMSRRRQRSVCRRERGSPGRMPRPLPSC